MRAEQPSFSSGEVAPEVAARIDVAKRNTALRLARNVIGLRQGGVASRPGTELVGQVRDPHQVRLIPFQFSATDAHCLEFAYEKFRVIEDGANVTAAPTDVAAIVSLNPAVLQMPGHGLEDGQHVFLSGFAGLEDSDGLSGLNGRTFIVRARPPFDPASATTLDQIELQTLRSKPVNLSGLTAPGALGTVAALYEITTPYKAEELPELRYEQSADVMYLAHPAHPLNKLSRLASANWKLEEVHFHSKVQPPTDVSVASTPGTGTSSFRSYSYRVTGVNDETGQESELSGGPASIDNDLTLAGAANIVSWHAPPVSGDQAPTRYAVYKNSNGLYGYIGSAEGLSFVDDNIDPDLGNTPPIKIDALGDTGAYPDAVGFFEQRLYAAGTDAKPNGVWASRSGDFENMNYSRPLKADDALSFAISARQVNRVLHLVPMNDLLAFTSDTVFKINGGAGDAVTPSSIVVRPQVHRGASRVRPIVIDDAILYVTAKGSRLRNLGYQLQADSYQGSDLTVFSSHFFEGREITDMAWCEHPHSAVFCLTDEGKLLCLTWMPEQEVYGWSLLETDGVIESLCAVTEEGRDSIYLAVRRENMVNDNHGSFVFVERLAQPFGGGDHIEDAVYLDSAVTYAGDPADVFSGLEHLENRTVKALADGHVVSGLTVTGGKVRLAEEASRVVVGIPYRAMIKTLTPVDPQRPTQGLRQAITGATVRLRNTRGVKVGSDPERLETIKPLYEPLWGAPAELICGDVRVAFDTGWAPDIGVIVQQDEPLPMTVLGVYADLGVGG